MKQPKIKLSPGVFAEVGSYADACGASDEPVVKQRGTRLNEALAPTVRGGVLNTAKLTLNARDMLVSHLETEADGGCFDHPATGPALRRLAAKLKEIPV